MWKIQDVESFDSLERKRYYSLVIYHHVSIRPRQIYRHPELQRSFPLYSSYKSCRENPPVGCLNSFAHASRRQTQWFVENFVSDHRPNVPHPHRSEGDHSHPSFRSDGEINLQRNSCTCRLHRPIDGKVRWSLPDHNNYSQKETNPLHNRFEHILHPVLYKHYLLATEESSDGNRCISDVRW